MFMLTNTTKSNPRTDISPEYLIGEENGLIHRQRLTSVDRRCSAIFSSSSSSSSSLCSYLRTHDLFNAGMYTNVYREEGEEERERGERKIELKPRKM